MGRFGPRTIHSLLSGLAFVGVMGIGQRAQAQSIPNFAPPVSNPFSLSLIPSGDWVYPKVVDIDGDGDKDIIGGTGDRVVNLFQNTGTVGNPNFAAPVAGPYGFDTSYTSFAVHFSDLDGDGDFDALAGGINGQVEYFENTGQATNPMFASPITGPFGIDSVLNLITMAEIGDLDGDGDLDILYGEGFEDWIYLENVGTSTNPSFASQSLNPFGLPPFPATYGFFSFGDLDQDGDLDIMTATDTGAFAYIENIGTANAAAYTTPVLNPFGIQAQGYLQSFDLADLDGDGDLDILTYQYDIDEWQYYENNSMVNAEEEVGSILAFEVFPNPADDHIRIQWEAQGKRGELRLHDLLGRVLVTKKIHPQQRGTAELDLTGLARGTYILDLHIEESSAQKRIVKK